MKTSDRLLGSVPSGAEVWTVTVLSSVASIEVTVESSGASEPLRPISRSIEPLTSAAVNGVPSLNVTPSRRWKTQVFGTGVSHEVASLGAGSP